LSDFPKINLSKSDLARVREQLLFYQGYRCAICGVDSGSLNYDMCVDHCHHTGKIRGILCRECNLGIGHFKDDPGILKAALDYLENKDGF